MLKNRGKIPDIAYDGILSKGGALQDEEHMICLQKNGDANFVYLDAANDFEGFTNDSSPFDCTLNIRR